MDKATIRDASEMIEHGVTWNHEPNFEFATEVDALQTLEVLGDQLRATREQVNQIMRWIEAAVPAARHNGEGETQPQAIINHSGLARQTVYDILKKTATPKAYTLTVDPETVRWLTATTGTDRLGGESAIRYGLEDLGDGRVRVPALDIPYLMDRGENEDGSVTQDGDQYTMWIEGLDYSLTPYDA